MLRVNLTQYSRSWDLPRDKILGMISESILGQALDHEPNLENLDISHPDVKPAAMNVISNYLNGDEPFHHLHGLASTAKYLNLPLLLPYEDPMYDRVISIDWNSPDNLILLEDAAQNGHLHLVSYLLQKGVSPILEVVPTPTYNKIIYDGTYDRTKAVMETSQPFLKAVEGGHLNIVKLLLADSRVAAIVNYAEAITTARNKGYVDMAQFLSSQSIP